MLTVTTTAAPTMAVQEAGGTGEPRTGSTLHMVIRFGLKKIRSKYREKNRCQQKLRRRGPARRR